MRRAARGGSPGASEAAVEKFERWEEIERVAQAQVEAINELYRTDGITFIDPSFPPTDKALYQSTESATTWVCRACQGRNPLPPPPDANQLIRMLHDPDAPQKMIRCGRCQSESSALETAMRPSGWARPSELRDDVTLQFSTVPWMLIRDEPRPDDIRQGACGNCWFVCAMSALAETPAHIRSILVTETFNHAGVYQVRLCRAGEWHCVLIDDVLPINPLTCLAYLKAARRSLWGPLIEKAAAKLHGSYEALNGGTFSEAFGMLTGMPVQNIRLGRYKPPEPPPPTASADERAGHERRLEKWKAKGYDLDELYAQLFSFRAAGFVVGCSTFFHTEKEIAEARAAGIQVPHAYCLLELTTCDGEELVKLRNPNGHAGWKGDWSRGSSKWTYESRQQLKTDTEDAGVFWMSWSDFTRLFAEVCVCRVLPQHLEARQGRWLASIFGAGQAMEVEVYAHTQLELTVHQEAHSTAASPRSPHSKTSAAVLRLGAADRCRRRRGRCHGRRRLGWGRGGGRVGRRRKRSPSAYGERMPYSSVSIDTTSPATASRRVTSWFRSALGTSPPPSRASLRRRCSPRRCSCLCRALPAPPRLRDDPNRHLARREAAAARPSADGRDAQPLHAGEGRMDRRRGEPLAVPHPDRGRRVGTYQGLHEQPRRALLPGRRAAAPPAARDGLVGGHVAKGARALDALRRVRARPPRDRPPGAGHIPAFDHLGNLAPLRSPCPCHLEWPAGCPQRPPVPPPSLDIMAALGSLGPPPGGARRPPEPAEGKTGGDGGSLCGGGARARVCVCVGRHRMCTVSAGKDQSRQKRCSVLAYAMRYGNAIGCRWVRVRGTNGKKKWIECTGCCTRQRRTQRARRAVSV